MKNIGWYVIVAAAFFSSLTACKEVGPDINLGNNQNVVADTTYVESPVAAPQQKNVVIEEFTGVKCPNCPQGHQIIAGLKTQYPERVVSVSFHPINSLGIKYPFSVYDFRSPDAQSLFDYIGQIGQEPAAGIDRKLYSGEAAILLDKSKWANYVNQQISQTPPVNILLTKSYDTSNHELTIVAEVHYTQNIAEENKLTVLLTESNMVSAQLNGSVVDTFYVHNDVMRTFITGVQGDAITGTREAGRVIRRVYKTILDAAWKPENMHIVAYVNEYQNSKAAYQGAEVKVID